MRAHTLRSLQLLAIGLATLVITSGCGYNKLQGLDEDVKAAWGEVQNQYQRRADLVPNLVATVKGAAQFEQQTLQQVIEARAQATSIKLDANALSNPETFKKFEDAQRQLSGALSRLCPATVQLTRQPPASLSVPCPVMQPRRACGPCVPDRSLPLAARLPM